jgi:two-component system NtrC family sensor kinase
MAFVVFLLRPQEIRARIFYWASLSASCALIVNGGFYCLREEWLSYLPGILFYMFYPLIPTLILHFSLTFLRPKLKVYDYFIYFPAVVYIFLLEYLFLLAGSTSSVDAYRQYQELFNPFRGFFIFYILLSLFVLIFSYQKAFLAEHKAQIKWILYGLFFGVGPFIFLYQLPRILIKRPFISEELVPVFFVFVPVAFAVSIIRFKLMDIELIINRSLVYSILTAFTVSFYLLFVQVIQSLFSRLFDMQQTTISVFGALSVALAFNPARKKIQEFVDRSFFRISYDYKKSILSFNERAHTIARQSHLVDFFLMKVDKTIPMGYIGLRVFAVGQGKQKVLIERGKGSDLAPFGPEVLMSNRIFSKRKSAMTELGLDFSIEKLIEDKNLEMVIPFPFRTTALTGYVELGKKKSGMRFTGDDIELLLTMAETFALNLERIHLQEEVIYERTEQDEILELTTDECSRLSRFLHNILDYGKIEQEVKAYHFQKTDISQVVEDILKLHDYQFLSLGVSVKKKIPKNPLWLNIDPDIDH